MEPNKEPPIPKKKKKRKPKETGLKAAKTGVARIPIEPQKSNKKRWILLLLFLLLLLLLIGGLLLWFLLPSETDFCSIEGIPTEYEIINCERQTAKVWCDFDVSDCPNSCLISYKQDSFGCLTSCECATEGLLESDVQFSKVNLKEMMASYITEEDSSIERSSVSIHQNIWDWNVVDGRIRIPYSIAPSLNGRQKTLDAIDEAIALFSGLTCVDFVPYTEERDYIEFIAELNGCRSYVGRIGGRQWINLSKECFHLGNILHLMLHTLGFWHENSRPDRDDYVTVNMENILPGNQYNFKPLGSGAVRDINSTYDINSITHFGGFTFSINQNPTIVDKAGTTLRAQRFALTQQDIDKINNLYICNLSPGFHEHQKEDHWNSWGDWQLCSASCGNGQRSRFRECLDKENTIVYKSRCPGEKYETKKCSSDVACKQESWGEWSPCTVTCNSGIRHRTSCCLPEAKYETEKCTKEDCPVDINAGLWTEWNEWGSCSRSCGSGWRRRSRDCTSKFWKVFEVRNCPWQLPSSVDIERCQTNKCNNSMPPPTWTPFGNWTECTSTCGNSVKYKYRYCRPEGGKCVGLNSKMEACQFDDCPPINKSNVPTWGPWSSWAICNDPCDETTRMRSCFATKYNVVEGCFGKQSNSQIEEDTRICSVEECSPPVDISQIAKTEWTQWGPYVGCSRTCGRDLQQRVRRCMQGQVATTGCPGEPIDRTTCGLEECILWSSWGSLLPCAATCGNHQTTRRRTCMQGKEPATGCPGKAVSAMGCRLPDCVHWTGWTQWPPCIQCGKAEIVARRRECKTKENQNAYGCPGDPLEVRACPWKDCFHWGPWDPWPHCGACGTILVWRYRKCQQGEIELSTFPCYGPHIDSKECPVPHCPDRIITSSDPSRKTSIVGRWSLPPRPSCNQGWQGVVDLNSDGADDIICIDHFRTALTWINNNDGSFTSESEDKFEFCQFGSGTLLLGDFDGDRSQDILCFDRKNKGDLNLNDLFTTLEYAIRTAPDKIGMPCADRVARVTWRQGSTFATSWHDLFTGDFCSVNTASLRVHHMNEDGKSDLVCVSQDGTIAVLLNQWND